MLDLLGSNWSSNCLVIVILYSWLRSFKFLFYQSINTIYHAFRNTTNRFDVKSEFHLETPFFAASLQQRDCSSSSGMWC